MTTAHINGIGTAVPEHDIHQPINAVMRTMLPEPRGLAMAFGPGMVAETFRFRMTG